MPDTIQPDQLTRAELLLLQRRALRSWGKSVWLATHNPRAALAVDDADPQCVRVDLSGGVGESEQVPGCIVLGASWDSPPTSGTAARALVSTEQRGIDLAWDTGAALPVADRSLNACYLPTKLWRDASPSFRTLLADELARVLVPGGELCVYGDADVRANVALTLASLGFTVEDDGGDADDNDVLDPPNTTTLVQTTTTTKLAELTTPGKEVVLGKLTPESIRTPTLATRG